MFFSANHQFLELFLETKTDLPQVTALTETWLKAYMGFGILKLAGYQSIETMNRNRRDGGVAFYVSEGISYNKVKKTVIQRNANCDYFMRKRRGEKYYNCIL